MHYFEIGIGTMTGVAATARRALTAEEALAIVTKAQADGLLINSIKAPDGSPLTVDGLRTMANPPRNEVKITEEVGKRPPGTSKKKKKGK